jgi:hypothetical protein
VELVEPGDALDGGVGDMGLAEAERDRRTASITPWSSREVTSRTGSTYQGVAGISDGGESGSTPTSRTPSGVHVITRTGTGQ